MSCEFTIILLDVYIVIFILPILIDMHKIQNRRKHADVPHCKFSYSTKRVHFRPIFRDSPEVLKIYIILEQEITVSAKCCSPSHMGQTVCMVLDD